MSTNGQHPRDTFRGQMIEACVAAGMDMGIEACVAAGMDMGIADASHNDTVEPAVVAGFMAMRLDRYVEMLEGLVNGEDLARAQLLIAERYR